MLNMNFVIQVRKHSVIHSKITNITLVMGHFVQGSLEIKYGIALGA